MKRFAIPMLLVLLVGLAWLLAGSPDAPGVRDTTRTSDAPASEPVAAPDAPEAVPDPDPEPDDEPTSPERREPGLPLSGIVVEDESGRPVPGANVAALLGGSLNNRSSVSMDPDLGETTTGADGRFAFEDLPRDDLITIRATAPGFLTAEKTVELAPGAEPPPALELRLSPAESVSGVVTDAQGGAVAGAFVYAIPAGAPSMLFEDPRLVVTGGGTWRSIKAVTLDDGSYAISSLTPGGAYTLIAMARGYARSKAREGVRPERGTPATADLRLRRSGAAVLRVTSPGGKPVDDAHGWFFRLSFPENVAADAQGIIRVDGLDPVEYEFHIDSSRFLFKKVKVAIREGETTEVEVRMVAGLAISGIVVDDRGKPLAGAKVECMRPIGPKHRDLEDSKGKAVSDENGRFRIEGLRAGTHGICADLKHHRRRWTCPVEAPVEYVRVMIPRLAWITMRLVPPDGEPPVERIALRRSGGHRNAEMWGVGRGGSSTSVKILDDGKLETYITDGPIDIEIMPAGYGPLRFHLDLKPGEVRDLGDIEVDEGLELRGRIVDPAGTPVNGARVFAGGAFSPVDSMTTGVDGGFVLRRLGEGEIEVEVEADGFLPVSVTGDTRRAAAPLIVTLHRGGVLRGTVIGADGTPVAGCDVEIVERGKSEDERYEEWVETDNRGVFAIRVPAGKYDLVAKDDGKPLGKAAAAVEEGGEATVTINLKK
jgi:Carboxypeptidase regulatory-like domain